MKTVLLAVLVLVGVQSATAFQCPASIPAVSGVAITQIFNGASTPYTWTISPTSPVSQPPTGSTACSAPGYISQYDFGSCQTNANQQTAAPQVILNTCKYSFFDGQSRTMTLTLSCDSTATTMVMTPTVQVTGYQSALTYAFSGKYAGVCDGPATTVAPTTTAAACPTNIIPLTSTINLFYQGTYTPYEWTISPTALVNEAPSDSDSCTTAAYISQYTPGGGCDSTMTQTAGQPYRDGNACVYSFTDGLATVMTLSLQCNAGAAVMEFADSVPMTYNGNTYTYAFTGSYAGVCTSPVPTTPAPTQVLPQCPTNVPAITTTLTQVFNGASTPYEWTISPTSPVSQPPADSYACTSTGYISQYTPGGSCDASANVQTQSPFINNNGACVYSFSDGGSRAMVLSLSCDQTASTMNLSPTVYVSAQDTSYLFSFSGTYAGVCATQVTGQATDAVGPTEGASMWKIAAFASAAIALLAMAVSLSIWLFRRKSTNAAKADPLSVDFLQKA